MIAATGVAAATLAGVVGVTPARADNDQISTATGHTIQWGACDPGRTDIADDVQCGTLRLPVDWSDPRGESFVTRVYRQPADGPRKGTVIDFPSGPGATADIGFTALRSVAPGFDLVGIDPRGVASTAPVTCAARPIVDAPLTTPADPISFESGKRQRESVAQSCTTEPRGLARHLDAYSNARDAEAFRVALGGPRLTVSGTSYGTLLAARYLELFGRNANGAVLQGVLAPGTPVATFQADAARGNQRLFDAFAAWCQQSTDCAVRGGLGPSAALQTAKLRASAGQVPGTTAIGRRWDAPGVVQAFEMAAGNGDFATAATTIDALSRGRNPLDPEGTVPRPGTEERLPFPDMIVCADFDLGIRDPGTALRVTASAAAGNPDTPYSTNAAAYTVRCSGAPRPDSRWRNPFRAQGDFPIMLLSNRIDPATPMVWAERVAATLGNRARHLVSPDTGHGSAIGDPKIAPQVREYLATR